MLARVTPAVVSVHTKQRVRVGVGPFGNDPVFRRMFPQLTQERINESLGSGVIVDAARGLVLTNHHVIEGADEVSVTLADERTFKAEFVGSESRHRHRGDADQGQQPERVAARRFQPAQGRRLRGRGGQSVRDRPDRHVGIVPPSAAAACAGWATRTSSRPTPRSIPAIPVARWSTSTAADRHQPPASIARLDGGQHRLGFAIPTSLARGVMNQLVSTGEVAAAPGAGGAGRGSAHRPGTGPAETRGAVVTRVFSGRRGGGGTRRAT
jgi:hypothetical protein